MATVPGDPGPTNVTPVIPKWAQPTTADFLQAAAIMHKQGKFQVAGDVIDAQQAFDKRQTGEQTLKDKTARTLGAVLGTDARVLPMTPKDK